MHHNATKTTLKFGLKDIDTGESRQVAKPDVSKMHIPGKAYKVVHVLVLLQQHQRMRSSVECGVDYMRIFVISVF